MAVEPLTKNDTDPYVGGLFRLRHDGNIWNTTYITHYGLTGRTRYTKIGYSDSRGSRCSRIGFEATIWPEECTWEIREDGNLIISAGKHTLEFFPRVPSDDQLEFMLSFSTQVGLNN